MRLFVVALALVVISIVTGKEQIKNFSCNQDGYLKYLKMWTEAEKSTSRDVETDEFQTRLEYFEESCEKIHEWNKREKYPMEFTFYADWSVEEFSELTSTKQKYSGIKPEIPSTFTFYNNTNWRHLMPSLDPCDEDESLRSVVSKPQPCSVSWAFAVTSSIEYAIKQMYLEKYNMNVAVALSAQELIDCVGKDHGVEGKTCDGLPLVWAFNYVFENGIAYRKYYPHTNVEGECLDIDDDYKYHIAGFEKPYVYNKIGLFDMVSKGPVAVSLGLDPEYFQYYQSDRENGPYFNTAYWSPSVYGVVMEYNQYALNGMEEYAANPYFTIETRLRACDSMVFRLPILDSIWDGNIAGIAGFAIRPIVNEAVPKSLQTNNRSVE